MRRVEGKFLNPCQSLRKRRRQRVPIVLEVPPGRSSHGRRSPEDGRGIGTLKSILSKGHPERLSRATGPVTPEGEGEGRERGEGRGRKGGPLPSPPYQQCKRRRKERFPPPQGNENRLRQVPPDCQQGIRKEGTEGGGGRGPGNQTRPGVGRTDPTRVRKEREKPLRTTPRALEPRTQPGPPPVRGEGLGHPQRGRQTAKRERLPAHK